MKYFTGLLITNEIASQSAMLLLPESRELATFFSPLGLCVLQARCP
jgi:hypothetical protein